MHTQFRQTDQISPLAIINNTNFVLIIEGVTPDSGLMHIWRASSDCIVCLGKTSDISDTMSEETSTTLQNSIIYWCDSSTRAVLM